MSSGHVEPPTWKTVIPPRVPKLLAEDERRGYDHANQSVKDLALLRALADRFAPNAVEQDDLAQAAFYRISELIDQLDDKERARSEAYTAGQQEMADWSAYLLRDDTLTAESLARELHTNFSIPLPGRLTHD